jgi:hypothetical protein
MRRLFVALVLTVAFLTYMVLAVALVIAVASNTAVTLFVLAAVLFGGFWWAAEDY